MSEWLIGLGSEGQLATWLVASFLLYTLASQLAWQFQWVFLDGHFPVDALPTQPAPEGYRGWDDGARGLIERARDHPFTPWAEEAVRFIYYLGIPFMAAVNGLLRADLFGISGTDWVDGESAQGFLWEEWARGLGLVTLAVLAVAGVWFVGCFVSRRAGLMPAAEATPRPLWQRLLGALYDQVHWAFYRSGPLLWMGDLYWGTFAGFALVALEAGLNPATRWALKSPEMSGPPLLRLGIAWISALLFLATQNLWLCLAAHFILLGLLGRTKADTSVVATSGSGSRWYLQDE
jgi:hypothetical protein